MAAATTDPLVVSSGRRFQLPLPIVGALSSCAAMALGWDWDISWHRSIGRDTPLSPPHISVYIALAIAFAYTSQLILSHTFGKRRGELSIRVFGFRGPAGAFITMWGILLQFWAILFDLWWHDNYGIDLGIFSPPHYAVMTGCSAFFLGQLLLVVRYRNTHWGLDHPASRWIVLALAAIGISIYYVGAEDALFGATAISARVFVATSVVGTAALLSVLQVYTRWRWAGPAAAGVYLVLMMVEMQVFMLFPATPKFGPVYHMPPHFLPPPFPVPLILPAIVLALLVYRFTGSGAKRLSIVGIVVTGVSYVFASAVLYGLFARFLASDLAMNRVFGSHLPTSAFHATVRWAPTVAFDLPTLQLLSIGALGACVAIAFGQAIGEWLRGLVR